MSLQAENDRLRFALERIVQCEFPTTGLQGAIEVAREALRPPVVLPPRALRVVDDVMAHVAEARPANEVKEEEEEGLS